MNRCLQDHLVPKQTNAYDCGVFVCMVSNCLCIIANYLCIIIITQAAKCILKDWTLSYTQVNVNCYVKQLLSSQKLNRQMQIKQGWR